jgi:predicted DNA-binding transcriptional regulator YafY
MRRADRLFDIIQTLRTARQPVTAAALADKLEVTARTVYRDIAALQGSRVPIEGAPGLGYVLRRGFDLPPLMFTAEEADAIAIGVRLLRRLRDAKLEQAAENVLAKLAAVLPEPLQPLLVSAPVYVSDGSAPAPAGIDPAALRTAIHEARKVVIAYMDEAGHRTKRTICPVAMAYYVDVTLLGAWCELRNDFRNFRVDRILAAELLDERFTSESAKLTAEWLALPKSRPDDVAAERRQAETSAAVVPLPRTGASRSARRLGPTPRRERAQNPAEATG